MSHLKKKNGYENLMYKRKREEEPKKAHKINYYYAKDATKRDSEMVDVSCCSNDNSSREDSEFAVEAVAFPDYKYVVEAVSLPDIVNML